MMSLASRLKYHGLLSLRIGLSTAVVITLASRLEYRCSSDSLEVSTGQPPGSQRLACDKKQNHSAAHESSLLLISPCRKNVIYTLCFKTPITHDSPILTYQICAITIIQLTRNDELKNVVINPINVYSKNMALKYGLQNIDKILKIK